MKTKLLASIIVVAFLVTVGCSAKFLRIGPEYSVCKDAPAESLICKYFDEPETQDLILKVANYEILKYHVFSVEDVGNFFDEMEAYLVEPISYAEAFAFISGQIKEIREYIGGEIILLSEFAGVFQDEALPVSDFDRILLLKHIENQRSTIRLYLLMNPKDS